MTATKDAKILKVTGTAVPVRGNDIDTDLIIPARYLKEITFEKMGEYAFFDERFDADKNPKDHPFNDEKYSGASILIVNKNFGCGSSREHAPQALMRYGISAIIGESFAEIFAGNCTMLGIPLLTASESQIKKMMVFAENNPEDNVEIDVREKSVQYDGNSVQLDMDPSMQKALVEGTWDSVSLMLSNERQINEVTENLPYLNNFESKNSKTIRGNEMNKNKTYKIAVLPGDGIGPEVMKEAIKVLNKISEKHNIDFEYNYADVGGIAYDRHGTSLPDKTIQICESSDAILFGSVGGPKWDDLPPDEKIERVALLGLRKHFEFFANLRPAICFRPLADSSPLKKEIVGDGFDFLVVRELTGGIYFGEKKIEDDYAYDVMKYQRHEVERIAKVAFEAAMKRHKKVTCVDKSNVLSSSVFFRKHVKETAKNYPEVELDFLYIDNATMQVIKRPTDFDVIVTTNMFGDILSDEAGMIAGSLGMLASASLNEKGFGMYEPAGGTAPDIAGKGIANPVAQILCTAMMLKHSFGMEQAALDIEDAVKRALDKGYRTADIFNGTGNKIGTADMGDIICNEIGGA
ncbi:MAG: 3-isopropylmalate dehydrogenase [Nanoarchaeota archaeon]|nr:3-isopropylmalate dehydrogenase [Nanoarchaeota archaeon]